MAMDNAVPAAQPGKNAQGGIQELVVNIFDQLTQLSDALNQSDVLSDEEKSEFGNLMNGYQQFVERLSGAPSEQPAPGTGRSPEQTAGNPNAKQMIM